MRQFKFRAWLEEHKIMRDFNFFDLDDEGMLHFPELKKFNELSWGGVDDLIIMQYLGEDCKDCNGIELCEGDIIVNLDSRKKGVIIYETGNFKIAGYGLCNRWHAQLKLGNIYQNPELLNDSPTQSQA